MSRALLDANRAWPPPSAVPGAGGGDTNMLIILAAMICAVVCALGFNALLRCARRHAALGSPEGAAARLAATGLKRRALRQIPVAVYGEGAGIPATDCAICLGEFADGEKVRVLPLCNHGFHVGCIDTWLAKHSSCPTCRHSLLDGGAHAGARAGGERRAWGSNLVTPGGMVAGF